MAKSCIYSHIPSGEIFVAQSWPLDRLEHPIYISPWPLAPLNSDGGRKSHIFTWSKTCFHWITTAQTPLSLCESIDFGHLCWLHVTMTGGRIEDVRIMGFYRSAETARQNPVRQCDWFCLKEYWLCRCVNIWATFCILHGIVTHLWIVWIICWERNQQAKPNPVVSFGREAAERHSWMDLLMK